ncbi:Oxidoreductase, short chain dehydrogenase/reductase family [Rubellimicrobium mesophilum DSM 19309]|uniref:Oxidoreductase, short chain dehydrogenase/reductase family n=1 Tax=Rubellimicrobium mesophilum DSM 19309 TaxID=442562 RepID=A0A017HJK0_9RHOB|nr:SDR family oxidoreductase [Rubellimicrobium mesophilum]EYD73959.1 Oxidoreductase, short chain dehydrogenase/reductase family [Rubellimicrobium mesophilum DSM 19309]
MAGVAIVTGAGTGIGRAVARALVGAGWRVGFVGRREAPLREAVAEAGGGLALPCDVTDAAQVEAAVARVVQEWGRLDLLFNNAGRGFKAATIDETPVEEWLDVVAVNLTGSFLCARAAFGQMRRQSPPGGRIINNGSVSAQAPRPGSVAYTATKHAITGLTKSLALDGRPWDIACGQIDIGNALTEMAQAMTVGVPQADLSIRAEPVMDVRAVADAVLYMAGLPLSANVLTMTVMATKMPLVGRG